MILRDRKEVYNLIYGSIGREREKRKNLIRVDF